MKKSEESNTLEFELLDTRKVVDMEIGDYSVVEEYTPAINEAEWRACIEKGSFATLHTQQIIRGVLTSLPFDIRRDIWLIFAKLPRRGTSDHKYEQYERLAKQECPCEKEIYADVQRTHSRESYFRKGYGRSQLQRVLRAYANYDPALGYPQGLNSIAGSLLLMMNIEANDSSV